MSPLSFVLQLFLTNHTVEATETIFLSNLEAGLSLLAVNLPSLWAIFNNPFPERILASLRGMSLFESLRSRRSSHSSSCQTWITEAEGPLCPAASNVNLATHRADYELQGVKNTGSGKTMDQKCTSTREHEVV